MSSARPAENHAPTAGHAVPSARRFVLLFAGLLATFWIASDIGLIPDRWFTAAHRFNARLAARLLQLGGETVEVVDTTVRSPRFSISVRRGCDAIAPIMLYIAALVALRAGWRAKAVGVAWGVGLLLLLNLLRIVSLYLVGLHRPQWFEHMHLDVWDAAFVFAALALWVLWARWALRPARAS